MNKFEKMLFSNVGKKIKTAAFVVCMIGFFFSLLMMLGLSSEAYDFGEVILAVVCGATGCLTTWLSTMFIYGFGQLIESTDVIAEETVRTNVESLLRPEE